MCESGGGEMSKVPALVLGVPRAWDVDEMRDLTDVPLSHPKCLDSHLDEGVPRESAWE